ncbi:MAG TPA: hypothetical protein VIY47_01615, partial [Ignavibacteriaceae bacterium]
MTNRFSISIEPWIQGFRDHIRLNPLLPLEFQLKRKYLFWREQAEDKGDITELKKVIEHNSSLRIDFGWSFESAHLYEKLMEDCLREIAPNFNIVAGQLISDTTCSWLGFIPYNVFERMAYEDLNLNELIIFNNEMLNFQKEVIQFICNHKIYKQHAILRDDRYRFDLFKQFRNDPDKLAEGYRYYLDSINDICVVSSLPRDLLEEDIGVHFLREPELFFGLLEFSILKGE